MELLYGLLSNELLMGLAGVALGIFGLGKKAPTLPTQPEPSPYDQKALQAASELRKLGLTIIPDIIQLVAARQYLAALQKCAELVSILVDPVRRATEFREILERLLEEAYRDPASRSQVQSRIAQLDALHRSTPATPTIYQPPA
jgi:hypothetical protein